MKEGNDVGLKVIVEVGKKGGGTLRPTSVIRQVRDYLEAGAYKIILESEELAEFFSKDGEGASQGLDALIQIVEEVGVENVILECPYGRFFPEINNILWWFVDQFGMNVNLGNIEPKHILSVETIRRGLSFNKGFGNVPVPER